MSKFLDFADGIKLPTDVVTDTQAVFGIKGGGKTYAMMMLMESMVAGGHQAVAIDPTGVWWGLTSSADGKSAGLDVIIMGGKHATVPLEATAGETIARFLVDSGQSAVLSLSHMRKGDRQRFCADFLEQLFFYKDAHREPLHLFMDEAQTLAPQRPGKDQLRVLGAAEDVVLQGRSRGLGMTMGTQRPAVLNKNLTTQVAGLILLRIASPQDQAAVSEWLDIHADPGVAMEVLESLGSLGRGDDGEKLPGDAWYISTAGEGATRIRVKEKATFDSSRTPRPGERTITPKQRTAVDLEKLSAEIRATVERAKANDPKTLAAEVDRLKKELARAQAMADKPSAGRVEIKTKVIEKFALKDGQLDKLGAAADKMQALLVKSGDIYQQMVELRDSIAIQLKLVREPATPLTAATRVAPVAAAAAPTKAASYGPTELRRSFALHTQGSEIGKGGLRRIMIVLAQRPGMTNRQIGVRAGLSTKGGTFSTYMSRGRSAGWIRDEGERRFLTDEGLAALGEFDPLPSGRELFDYWMNQMGNGGAGRILAALHSAYPDSLANSEIAERSGISSAGGTFSTYMSRLRSLELIEAAGPGRSKASGEFFADE